MSMEKYWIIGVGHFGYLAYTRLLQAGKNRHFVLVDSNEKSLAKCKGPNSVPIVSDGVEFLEMHLKRGDKPDWVVPALPLHLAAEWVLLSLGPQMLKRVPIPSAIETRLPHPSHGADGNLYVSHANFKCPDNCEEPRDICTVTRKKRQQNMCEILATLHVGPFRPLNIRSHQLGPGVGGYRAEQLYVLADKVKQTRGPILLSTACRCHGVVTALER
jgi:hypothetical protein